MVWIYNVWKQQNQELFLKGEKIMDREQLEKRIEALEKRHAERPDETETTAELTRLQQAREDRAWVKDMQVLGGNDYEAKKRVYESHRDAKLSPQEQKAAFRQSQEDEAWVGQVIGKR
jgi:precorrin-3B methylase